MTTTRQPPGRKRASEPAREGDMLLAFKALALADSLTDAARRVGAAIIDHFNRQTGQCDPSVEGLSRMLGLSRATVLRATALLHDAGLILKTSHGGHAHRCGYAPQWAVFRRMDAAWAEARKARADERNVSSMRPSESHGCGVERLTDETQTCPNNLSHKPVTAEQAETRALEAAPELVLQAPEEPGKDKATARPRGHRLPRKSVSHPAQRHMLLPIAGGSSHAQAARDAAERRWLTALQGLGPAVMAAACDWIDPARQEEATTAELQTRGGGLAHVLNQIRRAG
ncbi:MAG: helix-turn-helix domain-containing protein [Pannonibacter phragmitetus]